MTTDHDPLCPATIWPHFDEDVSWIEPPCRCDLIGRVHDDLRAKVRAMYDNVLERHIDPNGSIMTEYEDGEFNGALEALKDVLALLGGRR